MSSSSSSSTSSFDSDDETDARDLKPIRGYLSNRRELARQLFKSVKSDKIRMMLPQILKNMNLSDLEEWCASELCGMSEARILCILNGQTMLNSSDTSETDDSGPSLEIISDTEEWLTDTEIAIKEEPSSSGIKKIKRSKTAKSKIKHHGQKINENDKLSKKSRTKGATVVPFEPNVTVKKEKEKEARTVANKEGESLLDLLELEMRARAIRALIRKEEDIIPSEATEKRLAMTTSALRNTLNSAVSASLSDEKTLNGKFNLDVVTANNDNENCLENVTKKSAEIVDDEDVVFVVVKPTPTIELLSSDSETENATKMHDKTVKKIDETSNQISAKISNQRTTKNDTTIPETTSSRDTTTNQRTVTIDKSIDGTDSLKIVITKKMPETSTSNPSPGKSNKLRKISAEKTDKTLAKIVSTVETEKITEKIVDNIEAQSNRGLFKKIRRKQNLRTKRKNIEVSRIEIDKSDENLKNSTIEPIAETSVNDKKDDDVSMEIPVEATIKLEIPDQLEKPVNALTTKNENKDYERRETTRRLPIDDRLDDFEEIIDLDDYPDDMDEMENNELPKKIINDPTTVIAQAQNERKIPLIVNDTIITTREIIGESSETWASRYYQTDDVQNVIKESKIQSEIRKRLRERQRLSKLNSSPKLNSPGDGTLLSLEKMDEKLEPKPTGSVQEYLALKNSIVGTSNDDMGDTDKGETRSDEKEIEKISDKSIDENCDKSTEKNLEKSPEKSTEKSTEQSPKKSPEKSSEVETNDKNSSSTMEILPSRENTNDEKSITLSIVEESAAKVQ